MKLLGVSLLLILVSLIENEVAAYYIAKRDARIISCPTGFVKLGEHCYYFGTKEKTWSEALTVCKALDSTLAHPMNEEENSLIKDYIKRNYEPMNWWFGGTDATKEGVWLWTHDRSPINYTDWFPGEPNNGGSEPLGDNCVFFGGKPVWAFQWVDAPCDWLSGFICQ